MKNSVEYYILLLMSGIPYDDVFIDEMHENGFYIDSKKKYLIYGIKYNKDVSKRFYKLIPNSSREPEIVLLHFPKYYIIIVGLNKNISKIDGNFESEINSMIENGELEKAVACNNYLSSFKDVIYKLTPVLNWLKDDTTGDYKMSFLESGSNHSTMVDSSEIQGIINLFERGEIKKIDSILDRIVDDIRKRDTLYHDNKHSSIKRFFVELTTYILHTVYDIGIDVDELTEYEDPYETIFSLDDTPKIKAWFIKACNLFYEKYSNAISNDKESLINGIDKYIENNAYRPDLGLNEIADVFKLSSSYLSNFYSSNKSTTIVKYISEKRLELACKYLERDNLTMREIAEKSGFGSDRNFYTTFKKKYGVTPLEYRKKKQ